jgi:hypothetical protein
MGRKGIGIRARKLTAAHSRDFRIIQGLENGFKGSVVGRKHVLRQKDKHLGSCDARCEISGAPMIEITTGN